MPTLLVPWLLVVAPSRPIPRPPVVASSRPVPRLLLVASRRVIRSASGRRKHNVTFRSTFIKALRLAGLKFFLCLLFCCIDGGALFADAFAAHFEVMIFAPLLKVYFRGGI